MIKTILFLTVFLLSILGLCELIHGIWLKIISPKSHVKKILIVYLDNDYPEQQLQYIIDCNNWSSFKYSDHILAVARNLTDENYSFCEHIADENDIIICPAEFESRVLQSISK